MSQSATGATITIETVRQVLATVTNNEEQKKFYELWQAEVWSNVEGSLAGGGATLTLSTDLTFMELVLKGNNSTQFLNVLADFSKKIGCPNDNQINMMRKAETAMSDCQASVWCKFKQMNIHRNPSVDAGFILHAAGRRPMEWALADMLMPAVDDLDALREHAVHEMHNPTAFGGSIFPDEPERRLSFDIRYEEPTSLAPKKTLLAAFFFFKTLGFAKPEDLVVRLLSGCQPQRFSIHICMGPRGLTRLSVSLAQPAKPIAKELAAAFGYKYEEEVIKKVEGILQKPSALDYAADAHGYAVCLGWAGND